MDPKRFIDHIQSEVPMTLLEKLSQTDFILSMSSGFFVFFAHCGFAKAVLSEGLQPKLITGSSAGAIVAALLSAGLAPYEIESELLGLTQKHYWDPGLGFGFLKGEKFEETLSQYLPAENSQMKFPLHIATFNIQKRRTEIFKSGPLPQIVRASCAMPLFFHPVRIGKNLYWDGGIQDKMGLTEVASTEIVLGHSLKSGSLTDWFEFKKQPPSPTRHFLEIPDLPPTGHGNLSNAAAAMQMAYEKTQRFLNSEIG